MCILRLTSSNTSLKSYLNDFPVASSYDKGEFRNSRKDSLCTENHASLDVSEKEWDDLNGQIQDAIKFLDKYKSQIISLSSSIADLSLGLDFPIYSKFDGNIITHGIAYPVELVTLAAELKIEIGMTIYA